MFGPFSPAAAESRPGNTSFLLEPRQWIGLTSHLKVESEHVDDDDVVEHWVTKADALLSHQFEGGLHHT